LTGEARLKTLPVLLAELEAALAELEEAETLLQRGAKKAYIGFAGGICIEVDRDEALELIEKRKRAIKALIEKIKAEAQQDK